MLVREVGFEGNDGKDEEENEKEPEYEDGKEVREEEDMVGKGLFELVGLRCCFSVWLLALSLCWLVSGFVMSCDDGFEEDTIISP